LQIVQNGTLLCNLSWLTNSTPCILLYDCRKLRVDVAEILQLVYIN